MCKHVTAAHHTGGSLYNCCHMRSTAACCTYPLAPVGNLAPARKHITSEVPLCQGWVTSEERLKGNPHVVYAKYNTLMTAGLRIADTQTSALRGEVNFYHGYGQARTAISGVAHTLHDYSAACLHTAFACACLWNPDHDMRAWDPASTPLSVCTSERAHTACSTAHTQRQDHSSGNTYKHCARVQAAHVMHTLQCSSPFLWTQTHACITSYERME